MHQPRSGGREKPATSLAMTKLDLKSVLWDKQCISRVAAEEESPPRQWREGKSGNK